MAVIVDSKVAESIAANSKSADLVTGEFEFIGKGNISLALLGSAAGLNVTLKVGGVTICDDKPVPFFGTSGGMKLLDNNLLNQAVNGGRIELFYRNTSGGAVTVDYVLGFEPR